MSQKKVVNVNREHFNIFIGVLFSNQHNLMLVAIIIIIQFFHLHRTPVADTDAVIIYGVA